MFLHTHRNRRSPSPWMENLALKIYFALHLPSQQPWLYNVKVHQYPTKESLANRWLRGVSMVLADNYKMAFIYVYRVLKRGSTSNDNTRSTSGRQNHILDHGYRNVSQTSTPSLEHPVSLTFQIVGLSKYSQFFENGLEICFNVLGFEIDLANAFLKKTHI